MSDSRSINDNREIKRHRSDATRGAADMPNIFRVLQENAPLLPLAEVVAPKEEVVKKAAAFPFELPLPDTEILEYFATVTEPRRLERERILTELIPALDLPPAYKPQQLPQSVSAAVEAGDLKAVQMYTDFDKLNTRLESPLYLAVKAKNIPMIQYILPRTSGAIINLESGNNASPLQLVNGRNDPISRCIKKLLDERYAEWFAESKELANVFQKTKEGLAYEAKMKAETGFSMDEPRYYKRGW